VNEHGLGNLIPLLVWGLFLIAAVRRWSKRRPPLPAANAAGSVATQAPLARRRLAPTPAAPAKRPPAAAVPPPAVRTPIAPSMADTLPAEAAAAFPALDLSLPGGSLPVGAPRRRSRTAAGGAPLGSARWAADAIVAAEVLAPPLSLRPGATLGAPQAF
jgi:hypothetical protein